MVCAYSSILLLLYGDINWFSEAGKVIWYLIVDESRCHELNGNTITLFLGAPPPPPPPVVPDKGI